MNWNSFDPTAAKPTAAPAADSTVPQISLGTAIGVWALASKLIQSQFSKAPTFTLAQYLQNLSVKSTTTIIFTGHSLGGALSPTLANWAKGLGNLSAATIFAMPTAGPTPGNGAYQTGNGNAQLTAKAWDNVFPKTAVASGVNPVNKVGAFNCDVWNTQDVVPYAWQYIFTGDKTQQAQYYFCGTLLDQTKLVSQIGNLVPGTVLRGLVSGRQTVAKAASMTRSAHTQSFSVDWQNQPIQYYDAQAEIITMPQPVGPYNDLTDTTDSAFFDALGTIHVWGYGVAAFGLTFDVFEAIHPTPAISPA